MKMLFIDFDGVLHATAGAPAAMRQFVWLPILLDLLPDKADVGIVVHASAREESPADFLRQRLHLTPQVFKGVTEPSLARWPSIQHWISTHPDTSSFRILDDQASEFPDPAPSELILCEGRKGVSEIEVQDKLRRWLNTYL